jgi:hypothetical protein
MHLILALELAAAPSPAARGPVALRPRDRTTFFDWKPLKKAFDRLWAATVAEAVDWYIDWRGKMQVYAVGKQRRLYVKPGQNPESDPADWYADEAKKEPIQFQVVFDASGRAEVSDTVGRYLCAHGLAKKSRLIIPTGVKAA